MNSLSQESQQMLYGRGPELAPLHGYQTAKRDIRFSNKSALRKPLTAREQASKDTREGRASAGSVQQAAAPEGRYRSPKQENNSGDLWEPPQSPPSRMQGGVSSPEDWMHRSVTAGSSGQQGLWSGGDPVHSATTRPQARFPTGISNPPPAP